jgi:hypothetical protein
MAEQRVRWRVTYIATASDSSMPKRTIEFWSGENLMLVGAAAAHAVSHAERDGGKILSIERI